MRFIGFILLSLGFAFACVGAFMLETHSTAVTSAALGNTERKETFSRDEVYEAIIVLGQRARPPRFWLVAPPVLMLAGGILLGIGGRRTRT